MTITLYDGDCVMDWKGLFFIACCVLTTQSVYAKNHAKNDTKKNNHQIKLKTIEVIGKRRENKPGKHHVSGKKLNPVQGVAGIENEVPGVDVRKSGGPGQRTVVSMRGLPAQGTRVNFEGVPVNFPYFGGADVSQLALPALGGVDVRTGGMVGLRGQGYGSIDVSLPAVRPGKFRVGATGGALGFGMMDARAAFQAGPVKIEPMAVFRYCDGDFGFTDTNGNARQRTHNSSMAGEGAIKLVTRARENKFVTVIDGFADRRDIAGPEQFPSTTAIQHNQRFFISEHIKGRTAGRFRHDTGFYIRYFGFAYEDDKPPMGPKMDTGLKTLTIAGNTTHSIRIRGFKPFIGAGVSMTRGWTRRAQRQGDDTPGRTTVFGVTGLEYRHKYVEARAGVRADWTQGCGFTALPAGVVVVKPVKYLNLFGSASGLFRVPSFDELYFNAYFVRGNPSLKPETGWRFSGGFIVRVPHVRIRAEYFHVLADRLIMFLPQSAYTIRAENTQGAVSKGVAATVRMKFRHFQAITGYTWTDTAFNSSQKSLPYVPVHKVFMTFRGKIRWFSGYVGVKWQSGFFMDAFENLREEARWNLYAGLGLRVGKIFRISVFGNNLLDKRDGVDAFQNPLPGRQVFLSLTVTNGGTR